jgi:hypothetical protein
MSDRHVVALEVVVDHDLPVGRLVVLGVVVVQPVVGELLEWARQVALQQRKDAREPGRERLGVRVEVGEDQATDDLGPHREEAQLGLVQARDRAALGSADELAVEVVGPAVVGAAERLLLAGPGDQPGATVPAGVDVGADLAGAGADHDDLGGAEPADDPRAGVGHVGLVGHDLPGAAEDQLLLEREHAGVGVVPRVEAGRQRLELDLRASRGAPLRGRGRAGRGVRHRELTGHLQHWLTN